METEVSLEMPNGGEELKKVKENIVEDIAEKQTNGSVEELKPLESEVKSPEVSVEVTTPSKKKEEVVGAAAAEEEVKNETKPAGEVLVVGSAENGSIEELKSSESEEANVKEKLLKEGSSEKASPKKNGKPKEENEKASGVC